MGFLKGCLFTIGLLVTGWLQPGITAAESYGLLKGAPFAAGQDKPQAGSFNCPSPPPTVQLLSYNQNVHLDALGQLSVTPGTTGVFTIGISSPDTTASFAVTTNRTDVWQFVNSSESIQGTGNQLVLTFGWTPDSTFATPGLTTYCLYVEVEDVSCPGAQTTNFSLCMSVSNPVLAADGELTALESALPNVLLSGQDWQLPAAFEGAQVSLFDLAGRVLYREQPNAGKRNAIPLASGLYLYRIITSGNILSGWLLVK